MVTREKLFEEIWSAPMTKVAARYGVSSSFLSRVCDRLGIPKPGRGHWAKQVVGKAPSKPELPEPQPGDELEWSRDGEPIRRTLALPKPPEKRRGRVATKLEQPATHTLLDGARGHFLDGKQTETGYLRPRKRLLVDLFVTEKTLDAALDAANRLFLALEAEGHRVLFAPRDQPYDRAEVDERTERASQRQRYYRHSPWYPVRPTVVFVETVAIGLTIFELSQETEVRYVNGTYVPVSQLPKLRSRYVDHGWTTKRDLPTGRLCLRASSPYPRTKWTKEWRENASGELAQLPTKIIRTLEREATTIASLVEDARKEAEVERQRLEEQFRQWEIEERERRRRENNNKATEELLSIVENWGLAKRIEAFFADIEKRTESCSDDERKRILGRVDQARTLLGGIDALERFTSWKSPGER